MMKNLVIAAMLISCFCSAQDKKGNVISGAGDAAKLVVAKQRLLAGEYISALTLYREVLSRNPNDASTKYYVGLCQYNLQKFADARNTITEIVEMAGAPPQAHLLLGKLYQMDEKFEEAIAEINKYKAGVSGQTVSDEQRDADLILSQCNNALALVKAPVPVQIENLGEGVNSKYDDKNPCITADGRTLIFTTRRPETTNSPTDVEGDGKYFENIYIATADSGNGEFIRAASIGKPLNTEAHDACTSISPDGKQIFLYKNDIRDRQSRGGNVFVSKQSAGRWRKPESLGKPINSSYWEGGACVSPDGKRYFFSSEREGGFGASDIWMVEKIGKGEWGKPVNLGENVNTPYDEAGMFLAPDGKTLFFCSNGPKSMGSYDVFRTRFEDGKWTPAENVGYPINSAAKEGQFTISADASVAYLSSTRKGGYGESDLYKVDLTNYAILEKDFTKPGQGLSVLRGTIREGNEGYGLSGVEISVTSAEGQTLNTTTNDAGEYFFTLPAGKYTLAVNKKGYQEIREEVQLEKAERGSSSMEKGYLLQKQ